jgi:hypothetical protein
LEVLKSELSPETITHATLGRKSGSSTTGEIMDSYLWLLFLRAIREDLDAEINPPPQTKKAIVFIGSPGSGRSDGTAALMAAMRSSKPAGA